MLRPLSTRQAAERLGIHINTIKRIPATELPYYRVTPRGDRRYEQSDVEAFKIRHRERG